MLKGKRIGVGISSSFCSLEKSLKALENLKAQGADLYIALTDFITKQDSRFMSKEALIKKLQALTSHPLIETIHDAEVYGPFEPLDMVIILPCSANTLAKLSYGLCDNAVLMLAKSTLRHLHPIVLGLFTNDALGSSGVNIMKLMNTKNFYFIPFGQDDPIKKPNSMVCNPEYLIPTCLYALNKHQIQPVILGGDDL